MDFEFVENLNENQILELYEDIVENKEQPLIAIYCYCDYRYSPSSWICPGFYSFPPMDGCPTK